MNLQSRPPSYLFGWIVKKIISNNQTTCSLVTKVYQMVFSFFLSKTMSFCTRISTKVKFGCSIFNYFDYTPYWPKPSISFDFSHDKNSMAALNFRVFSLWFFVSNLCNLTPNYLFKFWVSFNFTPNFGQLNLYSSTPLQNDPSCECSCNFALIMINTN